MEQRCRLHGRACHGRAVLRLSLLCELRTNYWQGAGSSRVRSIALFRSGRPAANRVGDRLLEINGKLRDR